MSFTLRKKTPCSKCDKAAGVFTCRGCEKDFCYRHVAEHRQELNKKMDEVAANHNQLQQTIADRQAQPSYHPLLKKIDVWEHQSIDKIHQAADDARKELLNVLGTHRNKVTNDLTHLTQELNEARNEDDYVETDLKKWIKRLEKLKKDFVTVQMVDLDLGEDENSNALISKISISVIPIDCFERTTGDIHITENGRVAVHGRTHENAVVRGKGVYSLGQHQFRFEMEKCSGNGSFACGIVSKNTLQETLVYTLIADKTYKNDKRNSKRHSYLDNKEHLYAYEQNKHELDGEDCQVHHHRRNRRSLYASTESNLDRVNIYRPADYEGYNNNGLFYFINRTRNTQATAIIELFVDCDRKIIRFRNEQTGERHELDVYMNMCPFPWQFFITFSYANGRIRLCSENPSAATNRRI